MSSRSTLLPGLALGFALCSAAASSWAAEAAVADSRIRAVTVYPDRALVTREAELQLPAGSSTFVLAGLPASLLDASVQISGRGAAGVTIVDVTPRQIFQETPADPRVKELRDGLDALDRELAVLADREGVLQQQRDFLSKLQVGSLERIGRELAVARPSVEDYTALLKFMGGSLDTIVREQREIALKREDIGHRREALQNQLNELRQGPERRAVKQVSVRLEAAQPGAFTLALSYQVPGASWVPAYDVRVPSSGKQLDLGYFGLVRQSTGEDWNAVALTLSTARPDLGSGPGDLPAWLVYPASEYMRDEVSQEGRVRGLFRKNKEAAPAALAMDAEASKMEVDAFQAVAAVEMAATSATFRVDRPTTIPSDNAAQRVGVAQLSLPVRLTHTATPKITEVAYLSAELENNSDYPLVAGTAHVFLDGAFVASTPLGTVMPSAKLTLALGADEGVSVKRVLVKQLTENTGLTGSGVRTSWHWRLTVTNNKRGEIRLLLRDQVPVARHEKIEVEVRSPSESEAKRTPENGGLEWSLELKPGKKKELDLQFSVEHPKDFPISGL